MRLYVYEEDGEPIAEAPQYLSIYLSIYIYIYVVLHFCFLDVVMNFVVAVPSKGMEGRGGRSLVGFLASNQAVHHEAASSGFAGSS